MIESEPKFEKPIETGPLSVENPEMQVIQGAEILETPAEGNFTQGLHTFVAWVKSLLGQ